MLEYLPISARAYPKNAEGNPFDLPQFYGRILHFFYMHLIKIYLWTYLLVAKDIYATIIF